MTGALAFEAAFAQALAADDPAARPPGLDPVAARRFAVYRNTVHVGLGDALAMAYPATARLVGPEFFAAMARAYHAGQASRPPSLALHGAGFADFIDRFEAAAAVPYLSAVARLERAWLESYHAEDAPPLDANWLPVEPATFGALRVRAHPAVRLVASVFPIVSLWQANTGPDAELRPSADIVLRPENALVVRPGLAVQVLVLDDAEARFTAALVAGAAVADANALAANGAQGQSSFDAGPTLRALCAAGVFRSPANLEENTR